MQPIMVQLEALLMRVNRIEAIIDPVEDEQNLFENMRLEIQAKVMRLKSEHHAH